MNLDFAKLSPAQQAQALAEGYKPPPGKGPKYKNRRCQDERGRWFDSEGERRSQLWLERVETWRVRRQESIIVSDGPTPVRMRVDHVVSRKHISLIHLPSTIEGTPVCLHVTGPVTANEPDGLHSAIAIYFDTKGGPLKDAWIVRAKQAWNNLGIMIHIIRWKCRGGVWLPTVRTFEDDIREKGRV